MLGGGSFLLAVLLREENTLLYFTVLESDCFHVGQCCGVFIQEFLFLQNHAQLVAHFSDDDGVTKLAYLANIFSEWNKLNSSMQGHNTHAIQLSRTKGFLKSDILYHQV